ncbi:hypothetical protein RND81_05G077300 [Saponaria officinalis]|uniref:Uncharacterized protein n=1 Tax=Saponaria officinalis TaxID=3572 RepID=A0AAW1KYI8_SAPOF
MESKYVQWSAENATKAFLKTLKIENKGPIKELDTSEFISAIAAGNNAQLIVVACGDTVTPSTLLALLAATSQTRGRVICIFQDIDRLISIKQALSQDDVNSIEFVVGDVERLMSRDYKEADFVLNDCKLENHEALLRAIQYGGNNRKETIILGCNAFSTKSWQWAGLKTQLLPIGDGLLVTRIKGPNEKTSSLGRKSNWIVKVNKHTGEEHVFRVRCPNSKVIEG